MGKEELLKYVGDLSQIFGIKKYELTEGKSKGVMAIEVVNGAGMIFTVLPDRALDIASISVNGVNCSYMSKIGITNPAYNSSGSEFFRCFYAGFMTTCGLRNVGNACIDSGEVYNIHGRISSLPAENVQAYVDWNGSIPKVVIQGNVREATFFGENLVLTRRIICEYGKNSIFIENEIENMGFRDEMLMFLLHFNMGYPLLDKNSYFISSSNTVVPRDKDAADGLNNYESMSAPVKDFKEQVFYHDLKSNDIGETCVGFVNPDKKISVSIGFNKKQFDKFVQWKQLGEGEYVAGLEPSNCYVGGRLDPKNVAEKKIIHPFEKQKFDVRVDFFVNEEEIFALEEKILSL